jgi:hypothetical protein
MDKSLNSDQKPPWWLTLLQMLPLIIQMVSEIILKWKGSGISIPDESRNHNDYDIPPPLV